ncbi:hypothetical protein I302_105858 [Kwoniella bestiolae CBS 10118]|uniref:F-box domain-containing protein n=1 Tax=Kwoniella bestiolae CBS 10118 TaxID=1296100 RepID=A0AAJ8KAR4_9TREE
MTAVELTNKPDPSLLLTSSNGDHVPIEIIHHILSILEIQGQFRALCKVQQLSSAFHHLTSPYLYRHVHIYASICPILPTVREM